MPKNKNKKKSLPGSTRPNLRQHNTEKWRNDLLVVVVQPTVKEKMTIRKWLPCCSLIEERFNEGTHNIALKSYSCETRLYDEPRFISYRKGKPQEIFACPCCTAPLHAEFRDGTEVL